MEPGLKILRVAREQRDRRPQRQDEAQEDKGERMRHILGRGE